MTREELLKIAKPMMVNLEVAKTIPNKTQTRRVIKDQELVFIADGKLGTYNNPKWKVGDILWVREPVKVLRVYGTAMDIEFIVDETKASIKIPKRFYNAHAGCSILEYPKWISKCQGIPNGCIKEMARTFLRVTNVRVEPLQDISDNDVISEGINTKSDVDWVRRDYFKILWNKTAPKGYKWKDGPYVFVYEFEKVEVSK